ncbi:MAG: hypothetical protein ABW081_15980 [Solirubrobacteraceae bacterium]
MSRTLIGAALIAAVRALSWGRSAAAPAVQVTGDALRVDGTEFRVYGFNYEFDGTHPNLAYLDVPSRARLLRMRADFREAAALGANTLRLYVELRHVMASPTRTRPEGLRALRRTLAEARRAGLMVDLTGNLAWDAGRSPAWYDALPERERWQVQAGFWRAVAAVGARAPSLLFYELTSEPAIGDSPSWYAGRLGDQCFVQFVVRKLRGRDPVALARAWTRLLRDAVRSQDRRHPVSIGLLPLRGWAFDPANLWDLLDVVTVHKYPLEEHRAETAALIRHFAAQGRPLLLGETFAFDRVAYEDFLLETSGLLAGTLSFYDGRAPHEVATTTPTGAMYRQNLISYLGLRTSLGASPPALP